MYPIDGLKGQKAISPGQRPGGIGDDVRPARAKALHLNNAFALAGRGLCRLLPQGDALGLLLIAPLGRYLFIADNPKKRLLLLLQVIRLNQVHNSRVYFA